MPIGAIAAVSRRYRRRLVALLSSVGRVVRRGFIVVDMGVFFEVIFGMIALLLLAFSLDVWFDRSVVECSAAGLMVAGGWFGCGRQQRISAASIEKLLPVNRLKSGQRDSAKLWYDIQAVCRPAKKVTLAKRILGKRLTESVIRQIEKGMGRES